MLDYFATPLFTAAIRGLDRHAIAMEYVAYHNARHAEAKRE